MPEHVKIKVSPNVWAETEKSLKLGSIPGSSPDTWTGFEWFPKSRCIFDPAGFLTMPKDVYKFVFRNYKTKPIILNSQ